VETVEVEVLVIGSGVAGICAALASARNGCKTALVEMDPCLGGNAGPLLGVHVSGAHSFHPYASETGIVEELELEAARQAAKTRTYKNHYNISHQWEWVLQEKLQTASVLVYRLHQARRALVENRRIVSVEVEDLQRVMTRLFLVRHAVIEASGDGPVATHAGASFMRGTEGKDAFGERSAPKKGSSKTMGSSITALVRRCTDPVEFSMPPGFAERAALDGPMPKLKAYPASWNPEDECCFLWVTETGGERDTILDDSEIRLELLYQLYRKWDNVKNLSFVEEARNWELTWVSPKSGKRESRRFIGDHVLIQDEIESAVPFKDTIGYGGYGIDIHVPVGNRAEVLFHSIPPLWNFPYRCCYSKDLDNLWLAGRLLSVSHLALGTVRLMRTLGGIGQAVGTAVALAKEKACSSRAVGGHMKELQQRLLRQDATLLGGSNLDPQDLARYARAEASTEMKHGATVVKKALPMDRIRGTQLWDWAKTLRRFWLHLTNVTSNEKRLKLRLESFEPSRPWKLETDHIPFRHLKGGPLRMEWGSDNETGKFQPVAETQGLLPPKHNGWVCFDLQEELALIEKNPFSDEARYNLVMEACNGVLWGCDSHAYDHSKRIWLDEGTDAYQMEEGPHAFRIEPAPLYGEACQAINGLHRRFSSNPVNAWLSDFDAPLPQDITLHLSKPAPITSIQLTWDTLERSYRDTPINCDERYARRCAKAYTVEAHDGNRWRILVEEENNYQRWRVHTFPPLRTDSVRVTVHSVRDPLYKARLYEIRLYPESSS